MIRLLCIAALFAVIARPLSADDTVHVLIWDERQAQQLQVYDDYLGEQIAGALSVREGLRCVRSRRTIPIRASVKRISNGRTS